MAKYFALKSFDGRNRSFDQADRMALSMIKRIRALNARIVAVRSLGTEGFVFSVPGKRVPLGAVVTQLRSDPGLTQFQISDEATSVEGPFEWKKKAALGIERPVKNSDADRLGI
jgi:hypothetical protein